MYIYQHRGSNFLNEHIIHVRYATNQTIRKNSARNQYNETFGLNLKPMVLEGVNDSLTFKLFLYLTCLATENRLESTSIEMPFKSIENDLDTGNKALIIASLEYLKNIRYIYAYEKKYYSEKKKANITDTKEIKCCIIKDYKITKCGKATNSKCYINITFDERYFDLLGIDKKMPMLIPDEFFKLSIKKYRHSAFMYFYILLHRQRNYNDLKKRVKANVIKVDTLLSHCPLIPTIAELQQQLKKRNNRENEAKTFVDKTRIIRKPFDATLIELGRVFNFSVEYEKEKPENFDEFIKAKLVFEYENGNQQSER